MKTAKDLIVYRKSHTLAAQTFEITTAFLKKETFALTSQIGRSFRSVSVSLGKACSKRKYETDYTGKLTDCDAETNETETSIDFAHDRAYIHINLHTKLAELNAEIGRKLGKMIQSLQSFPTSWNQNFIT